jgi:hypothetical protein
VARVLCDNSDGSPRRFEPAYLPQAILTLADEDVQAFPGIIHRGPEGFYRPRAIDDCQVFRRGMILSCDAAWH